MELLQEIVYTESFFDFKQTELIIIEILVIEILKFLNVVHLVSSEIFENKDSKTFQRKKFN